MNRQTGIKYARRSNPQQASKHSVEGGREAPATQLVVDTLVPAHDPRIGRYYMLNQNGNNI
jgi:hypothetical protein